MKKDTTPTYIPVPVAVHYALRQIEDHYRRIAQLEECCSSCRETAQLVRERGP